MKTIKTWPLAFVLAAFSLSVGFISCTDDETFEYAAPANEEVSFKVSPKEAETIALDFATKLNQERLELDKGGLTYKKRIAAKNVLPLCKRNGISRLMSNSDKVAVSGIDTLFYIVNFADDEGFALIAADKRTEPVYALVDQGNYDFDCLQAEKIEGVVLFMQKSIIRYLMI
ncbi:MAG: Spi family protease inhibitor [Bacteroidaceae bacterium]|nr:Spi family protease inhibitor [Bacteroidaceae bacterium]